MSNRGSRRWRNSGQWVFNLTEALTARKTTLQGWQALQYGETTGTALNWPIPAYLKTLFAVCAAIMTAQTAMHVIEDARRIARRMVADPGR